jgi:DNA-binding NarL/FixJ family response regulator
VHEPIRVLIADDQELLRGSFRLLVDNDPGLTAVGEARDGAAAVALVGETAPHVVLMDVRMPVLDGIQATRVIRESFPDTRVLILTMFDLDSYVFAALRAGASGFLLKDMPPADLLRAIRTVADGESLLAPGVTSRLIAEFCRSPVIPAPPPAELSGLTAREHEVLVLVTRGLSNADIARQLHVSPATVKTHLGHLFDKLGVRDRIQLVILGYETGLVVPGTRPLPN